MSPHAVLLRGLVTKKVCDEPQECLDEHQITLATSKADVLVFERLGRCFLRQAMNARLRCRWDVQRVPWGVNCI